MSSGRRALAALAIGMAIPSAASAVAPRSWLDATIEAFEQGEGDGISIRSDGRMTLAPAVELTGSGTAARFWSVAVDPQGTVWAGGGGEGGVWRFPPKGEPERVLEVEEPEVAAVAVGGGFVYAASSPEGRIYRWRAGEKPQVLFEPPERYVWDLAIDRQGRLLVATGDPARIYRVDADGTGTVLLETPEAHVRCLASLPDGSLLAGTDGEGYVYRIPEGAAPFVLFAPEEGEITGLAVGDDGTAFVAAVGQVATPSSPASSAAVAGGVTRITVVGNGDETAPAVPPPSPSRTAGGPLQSSVYRLAADGQSRRLLTSRRDLILSLAWAGQLVAGTGERGALISLDPEGRETRLRELPVAQITSLGRGPDGRLYGASANPGSIFVVDGAGKRGTFRSSVKDAGMMSDWGRIRWEGRDTDVAVRTGNTARPDETWSDWSHPYRDPDGSEIDRPPARYLQYRATLGERGEMRSVEVYYLQRNQPPEVENVESLPAGIVLMTVRNQRPPDQEAVTRAEAAANGRSDDAASRAARRKTFAEGMRTFTWDAQDANDDDLVFDVFYRTESEDEWKPLVRDRDEPFLSFDSRQLPDERYRLRIVARDDPSNPPDRALEGQRETGPFEVDNTPPEVKEITVSRREGEPRLSFVVRDGLGPVRAARYSVDAGPWIPALPEDGVADSREEHYVIPLMGLDPGERTILLQAEDALGNVGAGRVTFDEP